MDKRKIILGILGIYLVILANAALVDGDILTADPLAAEIPNEENVLATNPNPTGVENQAPTDEPVDKESTTNSECICNCDACDCPAVTNCEEGSATENIANDIGPNPSAALKDAQTIANTNEDSTTAAASDKTTIEAATTIPAPIPCLVPGVQPDPTNCHAYQECGVSGLADGSYQLSTKSCPAKQAYNVEFGRCSRDISSCTNAVTCLAKGGFADPSSNTSYYWCEPLPIGLGFRIFHVDCSSYQLFYPELGKCFIDLNNIPQAGYPAYNWNQIEDVDIVKAELKLIKEQDKVKQRAEKDKLKTEKQRLKEEEKLKKQQVKQESATIICTQAGYHPSIYSETVYYACVSKKDKFKVVTMQCPIGSKFDTITGSCIQITPVASVPPVAPVPPVTV